MCIVPCTLEKNVSSAAFRWYALCISIKLSALLCHLRADVFVLIFCLDDQFIDISGVLKSITIIILLLISHFFC